MKSTSMIVFFYKALKLKSNEKIYTSFLDSYSVYIV